MLVVYLNKVHSFIYLLLLFLFLQNTDNLHQVKDYVRGCTISILTVFNKLKIMSEYYFNTDRLHQVKDYVRVLFQY